MRLWIYLTYTLGTSYYGICILVKIIARNNKKDAKARLIIARGDTQKVGIGYTKHYHEWLD